MYSLTIIRLHLITKCFENTEFHRLTLIGEVEQQLAYHNAEFSQVEEVLDMQKGNSKTIQVEDITNSKLWFYYIIRIN